jgi:hypothetical protein
MHTSAQRVRSFALSSASVLAVGALAGALLATDPPSGRAGGTDQPTWQQALQVRSDGLNRKYGLGRYAQNAEVAAGKVTVRITFKNDGRDVGDGSIAGRGHFTASGAITDSGTTVIYRTKKGALIILRDVVVGAKGTITFVVKIDTILATSRWTITSATKAYKGLHGGGTERENPPHYTVSTLTGTVSR